jgi:hypothetical protein
VGRGTGSGTGLGGGVAVLPSAGRIKLPDTRGYHCTSLLDDQLQRVDKEMDMNWTWNIRTRDGAMNGLEFARCTTAGGFNRVLVHAAPEKAKIEIIAADDRVVARGDLDRHGEYSPMTLVERDGSTLHRSEVWPTDEFYGLPVLLSGGEVGLLQTWHHAEDHSWWRWSVEFSNHTGRPDDWAPPGQRIRC